MSFTKGQKMLLEYVYDFADDGGAVSTIELFNKAGLTPEDVKVLSCYAVVETALASGGTPTITFGTTDDADGYLADCWSELNSKGVVQAGEVTGAYLWDDTNDHLLSFAPSGSDQLDLQMTIGTAALTAGKIRFYLEVLA